MSINELMNNEIEVYIKIIMLFSHEKEKNPTTCDNLDETLEGIMRSEISQIEKDT